MPLSRAIRTLNLTTMFPGVVNPAENILFPEQLGSIDEQIRTAQQLLDEGKPPSGYGYGCGTCFLRRLSGLLAPLRFGFRASRVEPSEALRG